MTDYKIIADNLKKINPPLEIPDGLTKDKGPYYLSYPYLNEYGGISNDTPQYKPLTFTVYGDDPIQKLILMYDNENDPTCQYAHPISYSINNGPWIDTTFKPYSADASEMTIIELAYGDSISFKSNSSDPYFIYDEYEDSMIGWCYFAFESNYHSCDASGSIMSLIGGNDTPIPEYAFAGLFNGINFINPPELPAKTLSRYCYGGLFSGCYINYIKCLAETKDYTSTLNGMQGAQPGGTFVKSPNMNDGETNSYSGVPTGGYLIDEGGTLLEVDKTELLFSQAGGSDNLNITTINSKGTATTDNNGITLSQYNGDEGTTYITVTTSYSNVARNGVITFNNGTYNKTVSIVQDDDIINLNTPLTFNVTASGTLDGVTNESTALSKTIQYNLNGLGGVNGTSKAYNDSSRSTLNLYNGDTIQFRGNNQSYSNSTKYNYFKSSNSLRYNIRGNIMSLINSTNYATIKTISNSFTFIGLFKSSNVVSAENLVLPATTISSNCYESMFENCSKLTTPMKILPAANLNSSCYYKMFSGCSLLSTAPIISATVMPNSACNNMFYNCSSLTQAPSLSATTLGNNCYKQMFEGCSSLRTVPELPATTLTEYCYDEMFKRCTSLTIVPKLPATTLATYCYYEMFANCTNLTTVTELPAETLVESCYRQMFASCNKLNYIKCLAVNKSANNCTYGGTSAVASTGTFVKSPNITEDTGQRSTNGIPTNGTVEDAS